MKSYPSLFLLLIVFVIVISIPYGNAISQVITSNSPCSNCSKTNTSNTVPAAPNKPAELLVPFSAKNITTLRTTNANVSVLQFTTSYNYQYITWSELLGSNKVIFVASSKDGGRTFNTATNLSSTTTDASNPHFVVNLGHMYGVFVEHQTGRNDVIKFTNTDNGGIHWNTFTLVEARGVVEELAIALQGDEVSVAWSDSDGIKTVNHITIKS